MSIFNPTPDDPNAQYTGAQTGATLGSVFGPVGALAGAFIGALSGGSARRALERARRRATTSAYEFGGDVYSYGTESRTNINKQFEMDVSRSTARLGASGATSEDARENILGALVITRDTALTALGEEIDAFREGPNYEWLRKDLELLTGTYYTTNYTNTAFRGDKDTYNMRIGEKDKGRSGQKAFTKSQRSRLIEITESEYSASSDAGVLFDKYAKRIIPSMEMFEKRVFGGEEGLAEYNVYMDARIADANSWYATQREALAVSIAAGEEFR